MIGGVFVLDFNEDNYVIQKLKSVEFEVNLDVDAAVVNYRVFVGVLARVKTVKWKIVSELFPSTLEKKNSINKKLMHVKFMGISFEY